MTDPVKRRRRWPLLLLAALVILIGGLVGWRFRPLSQSERQLTGTWHLVDLNSFIVLDLCLTADRRYVMRASQTGPQGSQPTLIAEVHGTWSSSGSNMTLRPKVAPGSGWRQLLSRLCSVVTTGGPVIRHDVSFSPDGELPLSRPDHAIGPCFVGHRTEPVAVPPR